MPSAQEFASDMLKVSPKNALRLFYRLCVLTDVPKPVIVAKTAQASAKAIRAGDSTLEGTGPLQDLADRWYESLATGDPDYGVYEAPMYLAEAYACWAVYSRTYLRAIEKPTSLPPYGVARDLNYPSRIVDLGCGIGFSTAGLAQLFPWAKVTGTNVPDCAQTRIAEHVARRYPSGPPRFDIIGELSEYGGGPVCLVFASEYFEHFQEPVSHLNEVISELDPEAFLIANTFTNPSIGHFPYYEVDGNQLVGAQVSRAFNHELRRSGYKNVRTKMWNNRPAYWKKEV